MSAFFHISWFGIFIISYDIRDHLENKNIVNNNIISIPFFSRVYITYWDLTIFRYLCLLKGFSFNMCLFRGFLHYLCLFGAIDLSILNWSVILMVSSRVPSFSWVLLFLGVTSFEPTGLPRFKRILDSFINCPIGTHQSLLEYLQPGYVTLSLSLYQWMDLVVDLQDFANEWFFELLVHIDLYEDQDVS